jgi:hypothetical protein
LTLQTHDLRVLLRHLNAQVFYQFLHLGALLRLKYGLGLDAQGFLKDARGLHLLLQLVSVFVAQQFVLQNLVAFAFKVYFHLVVFVHQGQKRLLLAALLLARLNCVLLNVQTLVNLHRHYLRLRLKRLVNQGGLAEEPNTFVVLLGTRGTAQQLLVILLKRFD